MPIAACRMPDCSRSGRFSRATSRRTSSWPPPGLRHGLSRPGGSGRFWTGEKGEADAFDAKADALAALAAAGAPIQSLQIVPGGPAWFHPGRSGTIQMGPQNVFGHFGELHPRALEALKADGPIVALRGDPRPHPRAEGEADARQADARAVAVPAGVARFRVRRRQQGEGRRSRPRGAECRQEADHRGDDVRRLRGQGHRAGQEIARDRRHDSAARKDHDRRGDRRARRQDRGRSRRKRTGGTLRG